VELICRVCGAGPTHSTPGTWGGMFTLEHISGLSMSPRSCFGAAGVFFCEPCFKLVAAETWSLFYELDTAYCVLEFGDPRKTLP
jgi:hypothetical protein